MNEGLTRNIPHTPFTNRRMTSHFCPIGYEESSVWKMVLEDLWSERITRTKIAEDIHLPQEEVEKLLFGLLRSVNHERKSKDIGRHLHLVSG